MIKTFTATVWGKQETLMASYKAVMRPALEYDSSIWLPLASSTSIKKRRHAEYSTENCHRMHTRHLHDDTYTSHTQAPTAPSHPLHKHTTQKTLSLTTAATEQTGAIYIHIWSLCI